MLVSNLFEANMAVPSPLYHVAPREQLAAILQSGIEPRAGRWFKHRWTPRVFFNSSLMGATEMAMMFESEKRHSSRDFVILLIDPTKIPEVKFRHDVESEGVWTRQHVPASAIISVQEPDFESDEFQTYMGINDDE